MKKYTLILLLLAAACRTAFSQCTANAGPGGTLTCTVTAVTLTGSSNVANATYSWTGPAGATSDQQSWTVAIPGQYSLIITDPSNGCTATATTVVTENTVSPVATATGGTLFCFQPQITLSGNGSSAGPSFQYLWTTGTGNIVSGSTTLNPAVNMPGIYILTVIDVTNGCTATATAVAQMDIAVPDLQVSGGQIGCGPTPALLSATSATPGLAYLWYGPNGFAVTTPNVTVKVPGTYTAVVTAPNGCSNSASVQVDLAPELPRAGNVDLKPPTCFGVTDGRITLENVSGGTPPYTYLWNTGVATQVVTGLAAGSYTVTIMDALACTNVLTFFLSQPLAITLPTPIVTNVTCFGQKNGAINLGEPIGGTLPYVFNWIGPNGFLANSQSISNLEAGLYSTTVTDANGCTALTSVTVTQPTSLSISSPLECDSSVIAQAEGGTGPYSFAWHADSLSGPVVSSQPALLNTPPGLYFLVATDAKGCTTVGTFIPGGPASTPCTYITGHVRVDSDFDCVTDAAEQGLAGRYLRATGIPGVFYGMTDSSGHFKVAAPPGNYFFKLISKGNGEVICISEVPVILSNDGDVETVDFSVQIPDPDCPNLHVNLSASNLRRCFTSNTYHLDYGNDGPGDATDTYVTLQLDPFLTIMAAAKPYTNLGNNLYRFDLGDLPSGQSGSLWVRMFLACNAVVGQTHCSTAHIYPDSLCIPANPNWSGARVEVTAQPDGDSLHFVLENTGTAPMSVPLEYIVIEDGIMSAQGNASPLGPSETMVVAVPCNGATWRIEAAQEPLVPGLSNPVLSVEGCTTTGAFSTGFVNQFPLNDDGPWVDENCTVNTASYDPNDKQGFPTGYGPGHYIRPGTDLEYLVRFQNTGNDTAFNVVIRDTLSAHLDPLSVRPGAASHPYEFKLTGDGILIFDFKNILLPDSNTNEPASHGFLQFRVRPKASVPLETDIPNRAAIYFDFNDPIFTNTTVHRIGENFILSAYNPRKPEYFVKIMPHPVLDFSWLTLENAPPFGTYRLQVFDLLGREVHRDVSATPGFLLQKSALPGGLYSFRVTEGGALAASGKVVVW